jgi:hypothetical protein
MGQQSEAQGASIENPNTFGRPVAAVELFHRRYAKTVIAAQQVAQTEDEQVLRSNHLCESRGR